jgi:hypothetical protein
MRLPVRLSLYFCVFALTTQALWSGLVRVPAVSSTNTYFNVSTIRTDC